MTTTALLWLIIVTSLALVIVAVMLARRDG
jgi:hypothetical protein